MKDVLKRLKEEYLDVSMKCDKLNLFLMEKGDKIDIHKYYVELMRDQLRIMYQYRECLYLRYKYICEHMNED